MIIAVTAIITDITKIVRVEKRDVDIEREIGGETEGGNSQKRDRQRIDRWRINIRKEQKKRDGGK